MKKKKEYIEKGELVQNLLKRSFYPALVKAAIAETSVADVEQVIMCEKCKFYSTGFCLRRNIQPRKPRDFCSLAERKESDI